MSMRAPVSLGRAARARSSEQTDRLLAEANKLAKKLGRSTNPFVYTDLSKWAPAWAVPARGEADDEEVYTEIRDLA